MIGNQSLIRVQQPPDQISDPSPFLDLWACSGEESVSPCARKSGGTISWFGLSRPLRLGTSGPWELPLPELKSPATLATQSRYEQIITSTGGCHGHGNEAAKRDPPGGLFGSGVPRCRGMLVLVLLVAGEGFLLPGEFRVQRSLVVAATPSEIFPYLNNPSKWPSWSAWNPKKYPHLNYQHQGPSSGVGAVQTWTEPQMGDGRLEIL